MTREEAIEYIKSRCIGSATERDGTQWSDAMWTAIEALQDLSKPNNTCEVDLISRQDAIDALMNDSDWADAIPTIKSLPSADRPTVDKEYLIDLIQEAVYDGEACAKLMDLVDRPTGEWIDYSDEGYVECPFCHSATNCDGNKDELHFCFSCGAKMKGGDDE